MTGRRIFVVVCAIVFVAAFAFGRGLAHSDAGGGCFSSASAELRDGTLVERPASRSGACP